MTKNSNNNFSQITPRLQGKENGTELIAIDETGQINKKTSNRL